MSKYLWDLWPQCVFIAAQPMLLTFAQRRGVLKALQEHTRVEHFRALPTPSRFVAILSSADAVKDLAARCPLRFQYVPVSSPSSPPPPKEANHAGNGEVEECTISVYPTDRWRMKDHMLFYQNNPIYGPWPRPPQTETFASKTLRNSIPHSNHKRTMSDWESAQVFDDFFTKLEAGLPMSQKVYNRLMRRRKAEGAAATNAALSKTRFDRSLSWARNEKSKNEDEHLRRPGGEYPGEPSSLSEREV